MHESPGKDRPRAGGSEAAAEQGPFYAHTLPPPHEPEDWEPLERHLQGVAEQAARFAETFGADAWGRLAGLWHDVGKYAPEFQKYLRATAPLADDDPHRRELRGTVQHAAAGAYQAAQQLGLAGHLLAYGIAGHHAGLPNAEAAEGERAESCLHHKVRRPSADTRAAIEHAPGWLRDQPRPSPPPLTFDGSSREQSFQLAFFARMLFSCLVDADFLETERFLAPERAELRPAADVTMADLIGRLDAHLQRKRADSPDSPVNRYRDQVLRACLGASAHAPGLFSLTVPTGGGKTFSSLAFALHHARAHDLRRVVVAIPFTSIIEQNAAEYRRALGDLEGHVIEHHSNFEAPGDDPESERGRLAAENWDAPIIVTTNVQLLESLFANRPGRCRKLHRLANSVIVLDEAQALPPNLLAPTLAALRELVTNYGCSIVLCTATQPALERRKAFKIGLEKPVEIIPEPQRRELFTALKRVRVEKEGPLKDEQLVERLLDEPQALCIVNTRRHAAELFTALTQRLGETETTQRRQGVKQSRVDTCLHLSANMCPRHRSAVLRLIRRRLKMNRPCRVISTQLVEAGVDVDFPVVYRAMAGLDAIAQAAGRCNREGRLPEPGRMVVFEPDASERRLPTFIRQAVNNAMQVLPDYAADELLSPDAQHDYFQLHYWDEGGRTGWDRPPGAGDGAEGVLACFGQSGNHMQFRQAAGRYRLIDDNQYAMLVPYGRQGRQRLELLQRMTDPPGRDFDRRLQRQVVTVHERTAERLLNDRVVLPPDQGHGRLVLGNAEAYDRRLGLRGDVEGMDPEGLTV